MNMLKTRINVIGKSRWDGVDDSGKRFSGSKIFVESHIKEENREGMFPTEFNLYGIENYNKFPKIPGTYEVELNMRAGSKGVFTIGEVTFVNEK